jgi:carboxyl-terminal processing protease
LILTAAEQVRIVQRCARTVRDRLFDPSLITHEFENVLLQLLGRSRRASPPEDLEAELRALMRGVRASHIGVFRDDTPAVNSKIALSASLFRSAEGGETRWFFQDVHAEGPADQAGIKPGDELVELNHAPVREAGPVFELGRQSTLRIRDWKDRDRDVQIDIPRGRSKSHPVVIPRTVLTRMIAPGVGLLKIAMFPGLIGIDVAREILDAVRALSCDRLIIDLRGNTGGGLGCIRVMSLLTPGKAPMGYSVSRRALARGIEPQRLPVIDSIPKNKLGLIPLLLRFGARDKSVAIGSEGLGPQRFHGRMVLLVNEHTASSAEMIAAFAAENNLCPVIGSRTAGRLVGARSFKVGGGFRVALPVVGFRTWAGVSLEGTGVEPNIPVRFCASEACLGKDPFVERGLQELVSG